MAFRLGVVRGRASMLMGGAIAGKAPAQAGAGAGKDCCNALKAKIAELEKELQHKKFQLASMAAKVAELEGELESQSKGGNAAGQRKGGFGVSRLAGAAKASRNVGSKRSSLKARRLATSGKPSKSAASKAKALNAKRFASLKPRGESRKAAAAATVNAGRLFGKNSQGKSLGLRRSAKNVASPAPAAAAPAKGALMVRRLLK